MTYKGMTGLSLAIRSVALFNFMLMIACFEVGMHDMEIPQEGFLSYSLRFWTFPTCGVLVIACIYRLLALKQRSQGGVAADFGLTALPVFMFLGFMVSNAGH